MKTFLKIFIIVVTVGLGIYVGLWLMFIGGIVDIVNAINPLNGLQIALGICKIVFCEVGVLFPMMIGILIAGNIKD